MTDAGQAAAQSEAKTGWLGHLTLGYERRGDRTVLARREHHGPLVVQKPLYPEGDAVCQSIIVHPPAGVVGGDRLALEVSVEAGAHAQLTTPGAAKWYRSDGPSAQQRLVFELEAASVVEWLPQETIVFDGARARLETRVVMRRDALFLGSDIVCLGRRLAGEAFGHGWFRHEVIVLRDGQRQWVERAHVAGASPLLRAAVGLDHQCVFGTFFAAAPSIPDHLLLACREVICDNGMHGVTRLPGVLLVRYRGDSAASARRYFAAFWTCARPVLAGSPAVPPRIWNT